MSDLALQITDDRSGRRYYEWTDGQYWSATTILAGGIPKPFLLDWAAKQAAIRAVEMAADGRLAELIEEKGDDAAVRMIALAREDVREEKADLGKWVHRVAEAWALGLETPRVPRSIERYVDQLRRWFEKAQPRVEAVEVTVYHRGPDGFRYAGTVDLIAWIRNADGVEELWLIDLKTGERLYPEAAVQLSAYGHATFIGGPDGETELPMPAVDRYGILHIRPTFAKLKPARVDEEAWLTFRHAAAVHTWGVELNRGRFEKPVGYPLHEDATWTQNARAATALAASSETSSPSTAAAPTDPASSPPPTASGRPRSSESRRSTPTAGSRSSSRSSRRKATDEQPSSTPPTGSRRHSRRGPDGRFIRSQAA